MEQSFPSSDSIETYITPHQFFLAGIDPQSDDPQSAKKLKRYLLFLLSQLKLTHGFSADSNARLLIEIYPDQIGGAKVRFILEREPKKLCQPLTFCFNDSNDLIDAAVKLLSVHGHRLLKSDLYKYGQLWLLIIRLIDRNCSSATALLSEYGFFISDKREVSALIEEHCKPVLLNRAADTISFYFS